MLWQAIAYSGKCIIDKKVTDTCSQYKCKTHVANMIVRHLTVQIPLCVQQIFVTPIDNGSDSTINIL
jgi:hypothetical protein